MKSKVEEHCKAAFQNFLVNHLDYHEIVWEDVNPQEEPPDYYLWLDETQYAIEVTTLMEKVEIGKQKLPFHSVLASFNDLVDKVKEDATKNNTLHGVYVVRFTKPIDNFSKLRNQLHQVLLSYVQDTQSVTSTLEKLIFKCGRQKVFIKKLNDQKSNIHRFGPTGGKWEGDIIEDISKLIEERIRTKQEKLKDIHTPVILLLYDAYLFADLVMYNECLENIINLSTFHSLFLIQNDELAIILYSENPDWFI